MKWPFWNTVTWLKWLGCRCIKSYNSAVIVESARLSSKWSNLSLMTIKKGQSTVNTKFLALKLTISTFMLVPKFFLNYKLKYEVSHTNWKYAYKRVFILKLVGIFSKGVWLGDTSLQASSSIWVASKGMSPNPLAVDFTHAPNVCLTWDSNIGDLACRLWWYLCFFCCCCWLAQWRQCFWSKKIEN